MQPHEAKSSGAVARTVDENYKPGLSLSSCAVSSFLIPNSITKFERGHPERERQTREGWVKSAVYCLNISKTVADTAKVTVTNRKSHMGFPLTPRSMTLDNLELL